MKKIRFILLLSIFCLILAGCSVSGSQEASAVTEPVDGSWIPDLEIERLSTTGAMILFQLDTPPEGCVVLSGNDYSLQVLTETGWEDLPTTQDHVTWVKDAFVITAVPRDDIDWEWLYGSLEPGEYRICKEVALYQQDQVLERVTVYAEFRLG